MTLRHLRIFILVCETQSVTKTAKSLHLSQPAVSQAIRELEDYYHVPLFDRISRKLIISTAGERLFPEAIQILARFDQLETTMMDWESSGEIRIGSSVTIGAELMPNLVFRLQNKFPDLKIYIQINSSDAIEEALLRNQIDLALLEGTIHSDRLHHINFLEDELGVFCSENHPLSLKVEVSLEEIRNEKLLLRDAKSGTRQLVNRMLNLEELGIQPYWESTSTHALIHATQKGLGITILPKQMVAGYSNHGGLIMLNVPKLALKRSFQIVHYRDKLLSKAMKDFIQLCQSVENSSD
jgi:DNA-binding transcriptional LysR family regulator